MTLARRAVLAGLSASLAPLGPALAKPKVGGPAPAFTVTTFEHKGIKYSDIRGDVVLLNFWATWCAPCRIELPLLDAFARQQAGKGFTIYAVNDHNVSDARLTPLAAVLSFPLVTRIQGSGYQPIGGAYPSNFVIDRAGMLRVAMAGAFTQSSLETLVSPLIAEPRPQPADTAVRS